MLLDAVAGHAATHAKVQAFLQANEKVLEIPAAGRFPLDLDASFLTTRRFVKTGEWLWTREASPDAGGCWNRGAFRCGFASQEARDAR